MKMITVSPLDKAGYRKFGLTMAIIIAILFGLLIPWLFNMETFPKTPWYIAAVLGVWSFVIPGTLGVIYKPWMHFGHVLGFINTRIILGLVFFVMFTPIALLLKLLGKDYMKRKLSKHSDQSYWSQSTHQDKKHMENIY